MTAFLIRRSKPNRNRLQLTLELWRLDGLWRSEPVMSYTVIVLPKAEKHLIKLDQRMFDKISKQIEELKEGPYNPRPGADIKKLKGFKSPPMYRLRVGKQRLEYFVDESDKTIYITNAFMRSGDSDYR